MRSEEEIEFMLFTFCTSVLLKSFIMEMHLGINCFIKEKEKEDVLQSSLNKWKYMNVNSNHSFWGWLH